MATSFSDLRKGFKSTSHYLMFCYLLSKENEDGTISITLREMESETGQSIRQIKNFFDWLESRDGITSVRKSGHKGGCIYSIENEFLKCLDVTKTVTIPITKIKEEKPVNPANIIPPRIEDVEAYIKEKGYNINPETWYNFYQAKDWKIGINKMKNWHSCIATWVSHNRNINQVFGEPEKPKEWVDPVKEQYEKFLPWCQSNYPEYASLITFEMFDKMLQGIPKERFFITLKRMYESGFRGDNLLDEYNTYM